MPTALSEHLQQQLSFHLDKEIMITDEQFIPGGDISVTTIMATNEGKFFIKQNKVSAFDMFAKEYNGLFWLKEKSTLKVPKPLLYGSFESHSYLVMEYLQKQRFLKTTWEALGEGIALLHRQSQEHFGFSENNYIGSLSQANDACENWATFYFTQRIEPLFQQAATKRLCTVKDVNEAERIGTKLFHIFPDEPPALLHGDLWQGNTMACANNEAAIYDPAVYYGHREMDIAMTLLFGGFDEAFYHSYNEIYPLQNGWQQRVQLCQLYPLLVHLNLFGSRYFPQVKAVLTRYR